ncbi:hypothetical protein JCM10213v2_002784 [Rhodosporidiobolus nylandii]
MLLNFALSSLVFAASLAGASPVIKFDAPTNARRGAVLRQHDAEVTFAKHFDGVAVPAEDKMAGERRSRKAKRDTTAGTNIPMTSGGDESPFLPITIGTPSQWVGMVPDTGSSDVLLTAGANGFDPSRSSSLVDSGNDVEFTFVDGSIPGRVATDTVSIGGLTVPKQYIGLTPETVVSNADGIIGLGWDETSKIGQPSFLSNLVSSGRLAAKRFGLYISRQFPGSYTSELRLGGYNSARINGRAQRVPVIQGLGRWAVNITNYVAGSATPYLLPTIGLIDSGSTSTFIPNEAARAIYGSIPGSYANPEYAFPMTANGQDVVVQYWTFPCNATGRIGYAFQGGQRTQFTVDMQDLNLGEDTPGMCVGSIHGVDIELVKGSGQKAAILGIDLLKSWYTMWDFADPKYNDRPTITFAPALYWQQA